MRWLLTAYGPRRHAAIITSGRTFREVRAAALAWLDRHPAEQRCLAFDTRNTNRAPTPINRRRKYP